MEPLIRTDIMTDLSHHILNGIGGIAAEIVKMEKKLDGMKDDIVNTELHLKRMKKACREATLKAEEIQDGIDGHNKI